MHSTPKVPDHELICQIGGGSYGEVWLARNVLGVARAVKIVYRSSFDHDRPFEREFAGIERFEPISRSHEGLVDLLQVGRNEVAGYFYYVMELADDLNAEGRGQNSEPTATGDGYIPRTLAAELQKQGRLPLDRCIEVGLTLTGALAHLHGKGLVHRDIKPSNIVFVGGVPKLADVGLVASLGEARSYVGTEGFIPPEGPGTVQADIYSLGILFYVLSTGKSPRVFPEPPNDLAQRSDRAPWLEFQAIIHRACAPDPGHRYTTAEAVNADLGALQSGRSVLTRHARERYWLWTRRCLIATTASVGALMLLWLAVSRSLADHEGDPSPIAEANRLFDLGRHEFEQSKKTAAGTRNALQLFSEAVRLDPKFARAYAWLAASQCWSGAGTNRYWEFLPQARHTAERALALDPHLAKAHLALAWSKFFLDWDVNAAEGHFRKARQYAPRDPDSYEWRAVALSWQGRFKEAMESVDTALALEQDSISARHFHAGVLCAARRYDEAIAEFKTVLQMEPGGVLEAYLGYANALILAGHFEEGIAAKRQAEIRDPFTKSNADQKAEALLTAYRKDPPNGYWRQLLTWAEAASPETEPYTLADLHARLGHTNEALNLLLEAERQRDTDLWALVANDPALDPLRPLPQFKALLRRLNLSPEAPRPPDHRDRRK